MDEDDIMQVGGFRYIQHETVLCIEDIKNPKVQYVIQ